MQRQHFQARSLNTAKMTHDKFIVKKIKRTNTTEISNGQDSEAARSMKWAVADMFAKARLAREKSAARWKNTKNIHLTSIFNISDQGPKKFPK